MSAQTLARGLRVASKCSRSACSRRMVATAADARGKNAWEDPLNPRSWRENHYAWLIVTLSGIATYATCKVWFGSKQRELRDGLVGPDRTYETSSPEAKKSMTPLYREAK